MILDIDPKVDYAFKHLFGRVESKPILINVLDSVLNPATGHEIREIELLNPFNPKETPDDKLSVLDIKARDQSSRQFNVEMQMLAVPDFVQRILFYACELHNDQLEEGQDYYEMKPTISISFLDHILFRQVPDHHLRFRLLEQVHGFPLSKDLEFHILELPKFTKSAEELATALDSWLYFLRHAEKMNTEAVPIPLQQPLVLRALEELRMFAQTKEDRERYRARLKAQRDFNSMLRGARLEGEEHGRQEGRREGRQEGRQEGRHEGRQEGEKIGVIQMCERLLRRPNTPTETLAALSLDELTRLADELQRQIDTARQP